MENLNKRQTERIIEDKDIIIKELIHTHTHTERERERERAKITSQEGKKWNRYGKKNLFPVPTQGFQGY